MAKKVTLDDVARATNLSKYAVSRAISQKPGISEETRARVLEACKKLGYVKSPTKNNDKYILILMPESDLNDATFWIWVLQGTESAATERGYALHVKVIKDDEDVMLKTEVEKAAGVLYAGHKSVGCARRFLTLNRPGVLMTYPPESLFPMDVIHTEDRESGMMLCSQMLQQGHTRIAFYGTTQRPSTLNRLKGVQDVLKEHNMSLSYLWNDERYLQHPVMMEELTRLHKNGQLPTAILCSFESLAQSMVYMLNSLQLLVPDDISVASFNLEINKESPIPVSGTGLNKQEYGWLAVKYLCERIENSKLPFRRLTILPSLLLRGTVSSVKKEK